MKLLILLCSICVLAFLEPVSLAPTNQTVEIHDAPPKLHRVQLKPFEEEKPTEDGIKPVEPEPKASLMVKFNRDTTVCRHLCEDRYTKEDAHLDICSRGCRFFILNEVLTIESDPLVKLNKTTVGCMNSCSKAYYKDADQTACNVGCSRAVLHTGVSDADLKNIANDKTTTITSTAAPTMVDMHMEDSLESTRRAMIAHMMSAFKAMQEQSRRFMENVERESKTEGNEEDKDHAGMPPPLAFSRSMSILITKDAEGNRKVIVVHQPPRILIGGFDPEGESEAESSNGILTVPVRTVHDLKDQDGDDEDKTSKQPRWWVNSWEPKLPDYSSSSEYSNRAGWSGCMYNIFLRLFFIMTLLVLLYLIFWTFFGFHRRNALAAARANAAGSPRFSSLDPRLVRRLYFFQNLKSKYHQLHSSPVKGTPPPSYSDVTGTKIEVVNEKKQPAEQQP